ncbi:hypothetical protein [Vibrio ziniensis]|uniref:Uncharacterized protein n=1 Tax=Vibrio ziniensis TaxID=2711221 RepID=A0A6G7CH26_9VIBR|nr:hypothetical protein [Vibrio ziniensis]QIH41451.1 hypothetical protein G5S32_05330 [Vibrio ziniensis]
MTNKEMLQKRIDELCKELGITEPQYTDKTTEKQLNILIDDLEAKLPDEGGDDDASENDAGSDSQGSDADASASNEESQAAESKDEASSEEKVLVLSGDLPDGATLIDDENVPEVDSNEAGDLSIHALKTFQAISHGKKVFVNAGETVFLEEQAAIDAVDAGVAGLNATMKG